MKTKLEKTSIEEPKSGQTRSSKPHQLPPSKIDKVLTGILVDTPEMKDGNDSDTQTVLPNSKWDKLARN